MKIFTVGLSGIAFIALLNAGAVNAQWIAQASGTQTTLSDVVMLDSVTAIAVGRSGAILRTENAGQTWTDISQKFSYGGYWNAISFFNVDHGIIAGDSGTAFTTYDGGKGWQLRSIPGGRKCLSALGTGPGRFYIGADSGWVYKTMDTGKTWTSEKISARPIRSIFAWRGAFTMGLPVYAVTPNSICSTTEFPEGSWKETALSGFQGLGSEGFDAEFSNGGGPGYIVGVQGDLRAAPAVLKNSIADTVWKNTASGIQSDGVLYGVSAPSEKTVYVCGSGGMMYKSSDAGGTWSDQTVNTRRAIRAVFFFNETRGFAVGDSGLILYSAANSSTGVIGRAVAAPEKRIAPRLSPNPYNGAKNAWPGYARVYDLHGRALSNGGNPPLYAQRTRLPMGVYLTVKPGFSHQ
jgi:photosystem II stability/assembly factor-like uncharacterized protein